MTRSLSFLALLAAAPIVAGCVVGPDYEKPAAPLAAQQPAFHRAETLSAEAPAGQWWRALGDPLLDRLVEAALASSPDVEIARARVIQARSGLKKARADRLPNTGTSAGYVRIGGLGEVLGEDGGGALELYTASFDATWELDLFGGKARATEAAGAKVQAQQAAMDGALVSLEAEVAQAYVQLRQLQQRQVLSRKTAEIQARQVELAKQRQAGGTASQLDVERLNNQLQSTRADLVPLSAQIDEQMDRLAVLTGREPGALDADLAAPAPIPAPPAVVTVGDPAGMLRRRPDVRQAERALAQSNAVIGQRTADQFPKVSLIGLLGYSATDAANLFDATPSQILMPMLQWTPFDFGRAKAKIGEAEGARDEALAQYRKTVLSALQDAETALSRYGRQRESLASLRTVQASADRAAALQAQRQAGGTASTLDVLDTERQRVQAQIAVSDANAALTRNFIALQKSLGLGWEPA
ncbi:efflux transporter outer membrane subunit [Caulobacter hibisci]|uniref:Efflux transporter outer membrane subunit n=1 Tax=Caulobacter hibisci TaxID=2035993 RepID=A0ABS0SYV9_9CAUL|nr:efflux transporter outer membrane subunit [Caulobacter hibisci]MBI1683797.1 efflux transporter outer membrane subunit [Caulobacter hibisci]